MTVHPLVLAVPVMMLAMAGAGLLMVRMSRQEAELQRRILSVTGNGPSTAPAPRITRVSFGQRPGWKDRAAGVFGVVLAKRDQYPFKWFWVVGVAMLIGRLAVVLAEPLLGGVAWVLMPVAGIVISRSFFKRCENKRQILLREQLSDALGLIVRAVRVGVPVAESLRAVARESPEPTGGEFRQLADQIAIGMPMDAALREMAIRNSLPEYGFFAAALGLQAQTGGGLTETLDLLADVTRKRVALRARGRALSSEARTTAMILAALPVVMIGLLFLTNPAYIALLFETDAGHQMLGLAALLLAIGGGIMQTIIQKTLA